MSPRERLSAAEARRVALAAQGFANSRPTASPTAGRSVASSAKSARSRSTRSTSSSAPTTSPCSAASARTARPDRRRRVPGAAEALRVLGTRGVPASGRDPATASLAHGARGRGRLGRHDPDPARAPGPGRGRVRAGSRPRPADRGRPRRGDAAANGARGGTGATRRGRSSGCSGRAASPRRVGGTSSGSTPSPSACSRPACSRRRPRSPPMPSATWCASPPARWASPPRRTCATTSACRPPRRKERVAELVEAGELVPVEVEGWGGRRIPVAQGPGAARDRQRAP